MNKASELAILECPMCGVSNCLTTVTRLGEYRVNLCSVCHGETVHPIPNADTLNSAYQDFDAGRLARENLDKYAKLAARLLTNALDRSNANPRSGSRKRSFLDYGCGGGHFLRAAQTLGFHSVGMEFDPVSVTAARALGLDVRRGALPEEPEALRGERFDVVLSFHVLEHVPAPFRTLAALSDCTLPGGVIFLGVPDQQSLPSRIKKGLRYIGIRSKDWGYIQPPVHLHGFAIETFTAIAERLDLSLQYAFRVSPLDPEAFPATRNYWEHLPFQRLVYQLARMAASPGYLFAAFQKPNR